MPSHNNVDAILLALHELLKAFSASEEIERSQTWISQRGSRPESRYATWGSGRPAIVAAELSNFMDSTARS